MVKSRSAVCLALPALELEDSKMICYLAWSCLSTLHLSSLKMAHMRLCALQCNHLRLINEWFLEALLGHPDFQVRLPSKMECTVILESVNAASKAHTFNQPNPT